MTYDFFFLFICVWKNFILYNAACYVTRTRLSRRIRIFYTHVTRKHDSIYANVQIGWLSIWFTLVTVQRYIYVCIEITSAY